MAKMGNSCLQRQGTVVFDTRPLCVTHDRLSYPKVRLFYEGVLTLTLPSQAL
jgi:hypothetical protein